MEGIRRIKKELPGVLTSLGLSNVSFGLSQPARAVLNSVMLYHAVQYGLDMAIVNPAHITPYSEISEEERALGRRIRRLPVPAVLARLVGEFGELKWRLTGRPQIVSRRKVRDALQPRWTCSSARAAADLGGVGAVRQRDEEGCVL